MTAIQVNHLSKSYGRFQAVNDISLEVEAGTVFALLGRNGAGKTTTIELVTGFQKPATDSVRVLGFDPIRDRAQMRDNVGIMLEVRTASPEDLFLELAQHDEISQSDRPARSGGAHA